MASRAQSLLSRLKLLKTPALGPQTEGTSAKTTRLRQVAVLFAKSVATYTACDAAAVIVAGQDISLIAQAGLAAAILGYTALLDGAAKREKNSSLAKFLDRLSPIPSPKLPLRLSILTHMAAGAVTGYAAYKLDFLAVAHHHRLKHGEWEEVPLSGRQGLALPAVTAMELEMRSQESVEERTNTALQSAARSGGFYYPADDPLTLKAQAILQQLLPAAMLMLEEHHGKDSPVVARVKEHFADWQPVVRVYHSEGSSPCGFASPGYIAIRDTQLSAPVIAHELGHTICRHITEKVETSTAFKWSWTPWALSAYFGHLLTMRPADTVILFSMARSVLLFVATLFPITATKGSAVTELALPGTPRLQPGERGYNSVESPSREIGHELEAERMAMFIMARAGYNPALVLQGILTQEHHVPSPLICWEGLSKRQVLQISQNLREAAGKQPERLTTISRAEMTASTLAAWPNQAKLWALYADALPAATAVFRRHRGPQPAIRWPPRFRSFKRNAAGLADS